MSKEMKSAYTFLRAKDALDAVSGALFKLVIVAALAAFAVAVPAMMSDGIHMRGVATLFMLVAFALVVAYFACRTASEVCSSLLKKNGFSEVELERMAWL